jgi:hypothetical protein
MLHSTQAVFVLVTADTCKYCKEFKNVHWPELKIRLSKDNRISKIVEISLPTTMTKPPSPPYPKELPHWIPWYPTIVLFTDESWNRGYNLQGVIYGGKTVNRNVIEDKDVPPRTASGIMEWIDMVYKKESIFKSPFGTLNVKGRPHYVYARSNNK